MCAARLRPLKMHQKMMSLFTEMHGALHRASGQFEFCLDQQKNSIVRKTRTKTWLGTRIEVATESGVESMHTGNSRQQWAQNIKTKVKSAHKLATTDQVKIETALFAFYQKHNDLKLFVSVKIVSNWHNL